MTYAFHFPKNLEDLKTQPTSTRVLSRNVRDFLDKELRLNLKNEHFLLAVSGGADSLAMLCLWIWLKPIYEHSFSVFHMNHMLRPESDLEAQSVAALCSTWGIECFMHKCEISKLASEQKIGIEEMSRHERYTQLEKYRKVCQAKYICLAHHLGDLQEDILMRLMRGSGWPALGGMSALDEERHILRPLLLQDKADLYNLLQHAQLGFAHDKSNDDTNYLRNRVRHNILPLIQKENPSFMQKAAELWQFASYDLEHWQNVLENLFKKHNISIHENKITLPAAMLKNTNKATRLRLYMHAIQALTKVSQNKGQARANTLLQLDEALIEGRGNTTFQLAQGLRAKIMKSSVCIGYFD